MKVDILMPRLGEGVTEGTIVKWWKKPGDYVKKDETLLEISTDKVDTEIPSPYEGTLVEILAAENETVQVDQVIARMETEAASGKAAQPAEEPTEEPESAPPAAEPVASPESAETAAPPSAPKPGEGNGQLLDVLMPVLGEGVTEGTIVKWWKKPGDYVKKDETLLEISTDKVDTEIPSPYEGIVKEILFEENQTVPVNTVIARIQAAGAVEAVSPTPVTEEAPMPEPAPAVREAAPSAPEPAPAVGREPRKRFYSPLVLSIARKEGISREELDQIPGTGLNGRVTKEDVLKYLEQRKAGVRRPPVTEAPPVVSEAAPAAEPTPPPAGAEDIAEKYAGKRVEIIPMDPIRKKTAEHMIRSKQTSAHVYSVSDCDFTRVLDIVQRYRPQWQKDEGFKLTINPFILYAVTKALLEFPRVNSTVEGDYIVEKKYINLGIAVATERGLIVPVLKNAEEKSFRGIAREAYELAMKARNKKLTLADVQDSTFSVTNYGVFGNIFGLPIINQPNVAILGVGAVKKQPVVIETAEGDSIAIRSIGYLSLTYDHRIIDGDIGGQFLERVVHYLETFSEEVL